MVLENRTIRMPDGRKLDVMLGGARHGVGLVFHHGTPGDAIRCASWDEPAASRGWLAIADLDTGHPRDPWGERWRLRQQVPRQLPMPVGMRRFISVGGSGGGPHSIACAALLPERCMAAAAA